MGKSLDGIEELRGMRPVALVVTTHERERARHPRLCRPKPEVGRVAADDGVVEQRPASSS